MGEALLQLEIDRKLKVTENKSDGKKRRAKSFPNKALVMFSYAQHNTARAAPPIFPVIKLDLLGLKRYFTPNAGPERRGVAIGRGTDAVLRVKDDQK
ncbi:MAG: hypothetical protein NTV52_21885 [Acidobacteria bacterium]|nr:hypothetical protein [Acidobacteriota bacterium]